MIATLHHQVCLILDPIVEKIQNEGPDGLEWEVFKLLSDAVGNLDKLQIHLVVDYLV